MASLRFRDLLRTKPQSLSLQGFILRGISWRTKTSVSGQPWGVCCLGLSTRPSKEHWINKFLQVIASGLEISQAHWGSSWEPDFILPSWTDTVPFSSPCTYHHGLALIRYYAQCPLANSTSMWNIVPNKDITSSQSNFILVMMFGQVSFFKETSLPRSVQGGDPSHHRLEVPNNLYLNLVSIHHLSRRKISVLCKCGHPCFQNPRWTINTQVDENPISSPTTEVDVVYPLPTQSPTHPQMMKCQYNWLLNRSS